MKKIRWRSVLAMCVVVLFALGSTPLWADPNPQLVGKWEGIWGVPMDTPIAMEITDQQAATVSGTVTITSYEGTFSLPIIKSTISRIGDDITRLVITFKGLREATFTFTVVTNDNLKGQGVSSRHTGPIILSRGP